MVRLALLISAIQMNFLCSGQQLDSALMAYYEGVNRAEMHIVDGMYAKAAQAYDRAFYFRDIPFGIDVYNRGVCAVILRDYGRATEMFEILVTYGYPLDSLKTTATFSEYFLSSAGKKLIENAPMIKYKYNRKLRNTYDSLRVADQEFRIREGSYAVYNDTIAKIDESNARFAKQLILENGFPSEEMVGFYYGFRSTPISLLILHNNMGSNNGNSHDFSEILITAVREGSLDARVAGELISGNTGVDTFGYWGAGLQRHGMDTGKSAYPDSSDLSPWGYYELDPVKEREINDNRKRWGLCPLMEERLKAYHHLNDGRFYLSGGFNNKILLWSNEKDFRNAIKRTINIE